MPLNINIRALCLFLAVFTATVDAPAASFNEIAAPIVYTGKLHVNRTGKDVLIRLNLIEKPIQSPAENIPAYLALLTLYTGDENSKEYATASYDDVVVLPETRELILQRDDQLIGRRFPSVDLTFSQDSVTATGNYFSNTDGEIGEIAMRIGWDPPSGNFIQPLGGFYETNCPYSSVLIRSLQIVPSRIAMRPSRPEGLAGAVNYLGNVLCSGPSYNGNGNCERLSAGTYDIFRDQIVFNNGKWQCQQASNSSNQVELECQTMGTFLGNQESSCRFVQIKALQAPFDPGASVIKPKSRPIQWAARKLENISGTGIPCKWLNQRSTSWLTHTRDGRKQQLALNLRAFRPTKSNNPLSLSDACTVNGTVTLQFESGEDLYYSIPPTTVSTRQSRVILETEKATDPILVLSPRHFVPTLQDDRGEPTGFYYSRLFGMIGTIERDRGSPGQGIRFPPEQIVMGANGIYDCKPGGFKLALQSMASSTIELFPWDPFSQARYQGEVSAISKITGTPVALPGFSSQIAATSFDFFTNTLTIVGRSLYTAEIAGDTLVLWGTTISKYGQARPDSEGNYRQVCSRTRSLNNR